LNDDLYGFIPSAIIRAVESKEDQRTRAAGVQDLERIVLNRYDFTDIKTHLPAFGRFINRVLPETNVNIITSILEIIRHLATVNGYSIMVQFLPSLMYKLGHEKIGVR
jgi:hypothetical protein